MAKERGKISKREWEQKHQHFESDWWGDCANTYGEETKQLAYAELMEMAPGPWQAGNPWPVWDLDGMSILDVGGGPASMLLKAVNFSRATVVDPGTYPSWTQFRYREHGVEVMKVPAEEYAGDGWVYTEAWMYNVLQHTIDPEAIIAMMRRRADRLRIFEWIETEPYLGHPHSLQVADLEKWVGGKGTVKVLDEQYRVVDATTPLNPEMEWRVEQKAWGGCFDA